MGMPSSSDEADVILIFGGDGTIHRHLGQLVKLGLPVLVVPAGVEMTSHVRLDYAAFAIHSPPGRHSALALTTYA